MASALERPVHMGKVYKYEARTFRQAERKVAEVRPVLRPPHNGRRLHTHAHHLTIAMLQAERDALRTNPARETLTVKCIKCIAKNFERACTQRGGGNGGE